MERPQAVRMRIGRRVAVLGSLAGVLLLLAAAVATPAQAAPGDLDLAFSGDGKQTTDFGFGLSNAAATMRQPDGKIIAVGADEGHAGSNFALARYSPDGSLDTSFSGDGRQTTDFGSGDGAAGVALQADGKIVAVGAAGSYFAIARYNPNGTLDTSFSGDGRQTTNFGGDFDHAGAVALQSDGKIVVVGSGGPGAAFALARYNPDGSLDPSFSGDGMQTTAIYSPGGAGATGVALQADGKIVAVGYGGSSRDFVLARYNPNGSLDTSFSNGGLQTTDFGGTDVAHGVAIQGDGKIVVVGRAGGVDFRFALARYNADGSLDTSFTQKTDFGPGDDEARAVALQGNGKIVVVGVAGSGDFALARYNPNGSLDTTFSGDGKERTDFGGGGDQAAGVVLQTDGKIVAVGCRCGALGEKFALARYNANGSLDTTFSGDGRQTTNFGGGYDVATGVALQGDGKVVAVGGTGGPGDLDDFALARYNPNGTLDTSFSGDGKQTTDFGGFNGATGVAIQADGKIVAVGDARAGGGDFAIARYNPNGTLDTSFSGDGKQTTNFGYVGDTGTSDLARGVAILPNGKIVAVGRTDHVNPGSDFALARYNPNGTLDTTFSGDGKQTTDLAVDDFDEATGVALQGDGKIVAVGNSFNGADYDFALARYNPNGTLDTTFSGDGKQTTDFFGQSDDATGVALQANGRIVAVGETGVDFALARYNPNGSLDTTFSGDGKQTTDFGVGPVDRANGVALQTDGKIVVVGGTGIARYNPNGSLDTSFSGDGKQTTAGGAAAVALQGDGKIVAVGSGQGPSQSVDFTLARYLGG